MDCAKVGYLIQKMRKEKGLTQKELANKLKISDKTISKWERGMGCPDISLISDLSEILSVNIESILSGEMSQNDFSAGSMKISRFFVCPVCGNISLCTGNASVSCCGRKQMAITPQEPDKEHSLTTEYIEDDLYISSNHPMSKSHYISFCALVSSEKIQIFKQYPEWNMQLRIPAKEHGTLLFCCNRDGLFKIKI